MFDRPPESPRKAAAVTIPTFFDQRLRDACRARSQASRLRPCWEVRPAGGGCADCLRDCGHEVGDELDAGPRNAVLL